MADMTLRDQAAREVIRHDLHCNVMVLAGAGAGKTHELVQRMVNCVRHGQEVERLAAITFTRKAAGELRGRFFSALRGQAHNAGEPEAENIRRALDRIDQCFIGTIHSFCARLLRERPVEARLSPDFVELDDREETVLRRKSWDLYIQQCFTREDVRLEALRELGMTTEDLFLFFKQRCLFDDMALKEAIAEKPELGSAVEAVRLFLQEVRDRLPVQLPKGRDGFMEMAARAEAMLRYRDMEVDGNRIEVLKLLDDNPEVKVTYWGEARAWAKELRDGRLPEFQARVLEPVLRGWRQYVYRHAAAFVDEAMRFYESERHKVGRLTFQDLLRKAAGLLRDHPQVRAYFQKRYQRLLVDEFQDTDPIQAEVLFYLTGADLEEQDWRRLAPRPGRLFLVGDEKQSIYRFRRADVETFRLVSERLAATGGKVVQLATSFRSLGRLCDWFNQAFEPLFQGQEDRCQAAFSRLLRHRSEGTDAFGVRRITVEKVPRNNRSEIAIRDAARMADFIAAAVAGKTEFNGAGEGAILDGKASLGDFLILTRTTRCLGIYAQALEARGLPYDIVGGQRLGASAEAKSLIDLLEAVHRPDDPLPLLGYLRGAFVGLGDDALYVYRQAGGSFNYQEDLPEGLPQDLRALLVEAFGRLDQVRRWMQEESPAIAFERLLGNLGLAAFSAAQDQGATRAGNLVRLLALVRVWESQGMHWGQLVGELRELIDDAEYKVEEMTLEAGQQDVVRLMNLHQAKGLEARVVLLADPYDASTKRLEVDFHVSRTGQQPFLSMPVRQSKSGYHAAIIGEPEGWAGDAAEEARFLEAENLRLVYVAATRARNLLVVSWYEGHADAGPWSLLYPSLRDIPELPVCAAGAQSERLSRPLDWKRQREERKERWRRLEKPLYGLYTVTGSEVELGAEGPPFAAGNGYGEQYGSLVHRLLELAVQGRLPADERGYIGYLLKVWQVEPQVEPAVREALDGFRGSSLWSEVQDATQVYTEAPFALRLNGEAKVVRGIIDLVYRVPGGWKIVDYKTDSIAGEQALQRLASRYAAQVGAYAEYWENVTGETVAEKGLWSTAANRWQEI